MKIEFFKNGMEIYCETDHVFVAYHAIKTIDSIFVHTNYINFDYFTNRFIGDKVEKYCSFKINLIDNDKIEICEQKDIKSFPSRLPKEKVSFWKRLFGLDVNKKGISKEAQEWLNDKKRDMKHSIENLNKTRNLIIKHFNNWSEKNEN